MKRAIIPITLLLGLFAGPGSAVAAPPAPIEQTTSSLDCHVDGPGACELLSEREYPHCPDLDVGGIISTGTGEKPDQRSQAWGLSRRIVQVFRTLEPKGLLRRLPPPHGRGERTLAVTTEGAALANKANVTVEAADREFFGPFGPHPTDFVNRQWSALPPAACGVSGGCARRRHSGQVRSSGLAGTIPASHHRDKKSRARKFMGPRRTRIWRAAGSNDVTSVREAVNLAEEV
jgi:hypothetical protein